MLIDFARAMKTEDRKGDVTLLGEVTRLVDAQTAAVKLDGSSAETLCQLAAVVAVHDKVTVLIRDHKAIITGNISNPAAANDTSNYIRVLPDGTFVIGRIDEEGHPLGFYVQATGAEYKITDLSGNPILSVTGSGATLLGSNIATMADISGRSLSHVGQVIISSTLDTEQKVIDFYGGTHWVQITDRFLLAAGSGHANGSTGGEESVTLTANQSGLRAHGHGFTNPSISVAVRYSGDAASGSARNHISNLGSSPVDYSGSFVSASASGGAVQDAAAANAAEAHNNMPPYKAYYMWERTA